MCSLIVFVYVFKIIIPCILLSNHQFCCIAVTVVALRSIMSVKQSFLDFRVTPDASGKWMKPAQDKISEIIKATFQANSCFSTSSVTLFTGVNGV